MSELDSYYENYTEKRGEHIEMVVEIYDSADAVRGHDLQEKTETTDVKEIQQTEHKGETSWGKCYTLTVVCVTLLLLCVLLLTVVTVLWIKYNNLKTENIQLQTTYNNLTIERDQFRQENSEQRNVILKLGWRIFNLSIYNISNEKKSWSETRNACKERGADLVIINSRDEQEFISKSFGGTEAWIGLTDRDTEGVFQWVDGTPLSTKFWWDREPNDYKNNEDCVISGYLSAESNVFTWADFPCSHHVFGICEMKVFN